MIWDGTLNPLDHHWMKKFTLPTISVLDGFAITQLISKPDLLEPCVVGLFCLRFIVAYFRLTTAHDKFPHSLYSLRKQKETCEPNHNNGSVHQFLQSSCRSFVRSWDYLIRQHSFSLPPPFLSSLIYLMLVSMPLFTDRPPRRKYKTLTFLTLNFRCYWGWSV